MTYRNYIDLSPDERDSNVYRITSAERVTELLTTQRLTLVKPKRWDDPFENALLSSTFATADGKRYGYSAKDAVYGQCWTVHRETDAMWRIYSAKKDGVRLTSSPKRLLQALATSDPRFHLVRAFIGKVKYLGRAKLIDAFGRVNLRDPNGSGIAESLLYKRWEFRHEAEVRLIYSGPDGECPEDLYSFNIDPNALIDKLLCDPRMDEAEFELWRAKFQALGFTRPIERSGLYRPPRLVLRG